jgi:hypothetical protein
MTTPLLIRILSGSLLFFLIGKNNAQDTTQYFMGILDAPNLRYEELEVSPIQTAAIYRDIPAQASLKSYAPYVGNQGQYGTCTAWASAYAARSIIEARQKGWTDRQVITNNAFSPGFLYHLCEPNRRDCNGSYISTAMDKMQEIGVPKLQDFNQSCPVSLPNYLYTTAKSYKTQGYRRLWAADVWGSRETPNQKIAAVKQSLSNGNPVVIGMICPKSFMQASGVWQPFENPANGGSGQHGRHAICVVGYDDNQYGGAFEIQNSWGTRWGNQGYIWIRYRDFINFVFETYELLPLSKTPQPKPQPSPQPKPEPPVVEKISLAGSLRFVTNEGETMAFALKNATTYRSQKAYPSGTRFRMYVSNNELAYVYAFSSDETNDVQPIFPEEKVSAALPYKKNEVAIPDEDHHLRMNQTVGTDYICFIYAKKPVNIQDIQAAVRQNTSATSWTNKVHKAIGSRLVRAQNLNLDARKMSFKAEEQDKDVVVIVLEVEHI